MARMSAHCTISPSGPPFSTRGLKTSPDSSVRKPMWIRIWRDKKRGQRGEGWCWGKGTSWVFQPKMTYGTRFPPAPFACWSYPGKSVRRKDK